MAGSDILVRIDGTSAGFDAAASTAQKAALRLEATLKTAATAQQLLNKAVAEYGAGSAEAVAAGKAYEASLTKVAAAEDRAAIASKRATEVMARDNAERAASAEAAAAKQQAALKKTGTAYGALGLAAIAGLALAAKAAADFEAKQALVRSLAKTATAAQLESLKQASFGFESIGASATDAADAEIELVKAGISVKDQLGGALSGTLDLAAAGQLAVGDAASIAAQAMTQFQLAGADIPHVADLLAAGADKAIGSVQDLGDGLRYSGLTAHQLGISVDESVAALAEFAQAGLIGSQGGAAFQQMLLKLENPTQKAADTLAAYNISLYDTQGQFVGMTKLAGELHNKLGDLDQATRLAALAQIFGSRAVRAANVLYQDGAKGVEEWQRKVEDSGFAAEQAAGKMDSLTGDFDKFKAQLTNTGIALGEQLQGPLREVVQTLTGLASIIGDLPGPLKETVGLTLAFTAVVGAGVFVYSRAKLALASMGTTMGIVAKETEGATLATQLFSRNTALARGGAAALGIGLLTLHDSALQGHSALQGLGQAAAFAALGFSVGGPWGAAIGGSIGLLTGMSGALHHTTVVTDEAITSSQDYASTLDRTSGAITRNTRAMVANALEEDGALKAAQALGIALPDVTSAILSNGTAHDKLVSQLRGMQTYLAGTGRDWGAYASQVSGAYGSESSGVQDAVKAQKDWADSHRDSLNSVNLLLGAITGEDQRLNEQVSSFQRVGLATKEYSGNMQDAASATEDLAAQTEQLILDIQTLDKSNLSKRAAFAAYKQSVDGAAEAVKQFAESGIAAADAGKRVTAAGTATGDVLDTVAQGALEAEKNMYGVALIKFNNDAHDHLVALAESFGASKQQAEAYAQQVLRTMIPATDQATRHLQDTTSAAQELGKQRPVVPVAVQTSDALRDLQDFAKQSNLYLDSIRDEPVNITLTAQSSKIADQLARLGGEPMAEGGPVVGPGGPKSDSILTRLSNGEHVITAEEVAAAGGHKVIEAIRRMFRRHQMAKLGDIPAFSTGGPVVVPSVASQGLAASTAEIQRLFDAIVGGISAGISKKVNDRMTHMPSQGQLGPGGVLTPYQLVTGQAAAQSQVGKPYIWGGVGPSGYDCSGFQSFVLNSAMGFGNPYFRRGSTASMPWPGSAPGGGRYSIGWTPNWSNGIGHTSGNIGGLNVESNGSDGVVTGSAALSPLDGHFTGLMHYDTGGSWPNNTIGANTSGHTEYVATTRASMAEVTQAIGRLHQMLDQKGLLTRNIREMGQAVNSISRGNIDAKAALDARLGLGEP